MREQANSPLRMQESTIQYHLIAFLISGAHQPSSSVITSTLANLVQIQPVCSLALSPIR